MHELFINHAKMGATWKGFALTRCKLSLLYSSDSTTDFGLPDMMARREASILNEPVV